MSDDSNPAWDDERARGLVGRHILIGITSLTADDEIIEQRQMHGDIEQIDEKRGIGVRLADGEMYWLPPDLAAITSAPPGEYRLRATGEVVVNPDLMTTWTVHAPVRH